MIQEHEAVLQITVNGEQGELPDPVHFDSGDGDIKAWATEAVRAGGIPGITPDPMADFSAYTVDRFPARDGKCNRLSLRPKVPFGG